MDSKALKEAQAALYSRIMEVMDTQKPYLASDFNIHTLASLVYSNRTYVSNTINSICGKNFHAWLADYRNAIILEALRSNPRQSVASLCALTGHNSKAVVCRQFKLLNGLTLTEYKQRM